MAKQNASEKLKESIRLLELIQTEEREILRSHVVSIYESFRLVNILKSTVKDFTGSSDLKTTLVETMISIVTGYITKKMVVKPNSNPFMKFFGVVLQLAVTSLLSKNADHIRLFASEFIEKFVQKEQPEVLESKP